MRLAKKTQRISILSAFGELQAYSLDDLGLEIRPLLWIALKSAALFITKNSITLRVSSLAVYVDAHFFLLRFLIRTGLCRLPTP